MEQIDFRAIIEELPLVIYVDHLDEWSSCAWVSPQIESLLGYTQEEWLANPRLWAERLHPDDRDRLLGEVARRNSTAASVGHEFYRLLARDGRVVWVRDDEVVIRDEDGTPRFAQGYMQDVTRQRGESMRLNLLVSILSLAATNLSPESLVVQAADRLAAFFGDVRVSFAEISRAGTLAVRYSTEPAMRGQAPVPLIPGYSERLSRGKPIVIDDVADEEWLDPVRDALRAAGVVSAVDVPLLRDGEVVGVLWFNSATARRWNDEEVAALAEVAEQLAVMLASADAREQRRRAEADLRRRDAILEVVTRAAERLVAEPTWEAAASEILRGFGEAVGASRAYVFENDVDEEGRVVTSQRFEWVARGVDPQLENEVMQRMRFDEVGLARFEELCGRDEIFAGNVRDFAPEERELFESQQIRSIMTVPIFVDGVWWGFIGFDECVAEREWSAAETDALRLAASLVAAAIGRERSEAILRGHEQKLRAVFDTALDAILISDDDRRYVDANPAACELLGVSKRDLVGRLVDDFLPPHRRATIEADWGAYLGSTAVIEEWELLHADGAVRHVEASARPNFVPGLHIAFLRDVTARKQLEADLLSAQKLESLGRLAGGVAHDFNNLLTAITGYATLGLDRAKDDPALAHDLGEIHRAAGRAAELTRQLLAFGRRQMLQPRALDLNDVLTDVSSLLRSLLGEQVELELRPAAPLGTVLADPGQVEQVLVNLAVNAREAMPDGGRLTISTRNVPPTGGRAVVELEVTDTGVGMDEATRAQIFEPFFTTRDGGVGLGLASVYGIVRQSGGEVSVQSETGRGSTFTVRLPRVDEDAPAPEPEPEPRSAPVLEAGSETILLVEDEDVVRTLARRVLERHGYTVLACADGSEAIELAERHAEPIDLLLTDVVMPGLRGHEVAARVSASRPEIKVLYMSGYAEEALLGVAAIDEGALIEKPFAVDVLAHRVREALA